MGDVSIILKLISVQEKSQRSSRANTDDDVNKKKNNKKKGEAKGLSERKTVY